MAKSSAESAGISSVEPRPWWGEFLCAGSSAVGAIICTNPVDVVKTRMQIQGQLGAAPSPYSNVPSAMLSIARSEGLRGLQRGLGPSCLWQFSNVSVRFGVYGTAKSYTVQPSDPTAKYLQSLGLAGISGAMAALASNPFFILKTRFQAATAEEAANRTVFGTLASIGRADGIGGYFRGLSAFAPRVIVASAVQLSTYDAVKEKLLSRFSLRDGLPTHVCASLVTGAAVVLAMQPFDFAATRLVNSLTAAEAKGGGAVFEGPVDVIRKSVRAEGPLSVYKGVTANYLRFGPYCILVFVFVEQLRLLEAKLMARMQDTSLR